MPKDYRWIIVVLVFLTTAVGMMAWSTVFPLLNLFVRDLGITRAQGGFLSGLFYIPGVFVSLPGSWMFSRLPPRRSFALTWAFITVGTLVMAVAPGYIVLCLGRLLFSIGMNLHLIGALKILADWFKGHKRLGLAMAVYSSAISVGVFCGMNFGGKLGSDHGWRSPFYLLTGLTVAGWLALQALRDAPREKDDKAAVVSRRFSFRAGSIVWIMATCYFFFGIGSDSFLTFTPDFLVQRGFPLARASAIVGSYAFIALFIKLTTSPFIKARNAIFFVSAGCLFGVLSDILVLQSGLNPFLASIAIGGAFGITMPAVYAMPALFLKGESLGLAYGIYQLLVSLGVGAQSLIGFTIDRTGGYVMGYGLMMSFFVAALLCAMVIYVSRRKIRVAA
jgi:predicted MFS family arabinose efflux permease